jgi:hypothetical protein
LTFEPNIKIKHVGLTTYESFLSEETGVALSSDIRWLRFVYEYTNSSPVVLEITRESGERSLLVGNYFSSSNYGKRMVISGAFLDFGPPLPIRGDHGIGTENWSGSRKNKNFFLTKEIVEPSVSHSQVLANIDLSQYRKADPYSLITSRARNDLRRAETSGVEILFGQGYIEDFYQLYRRKMKLFGTPHHGRDFFIKLIKNFPNEISCGVAFVGKEIKASSLDLTLNGITYHLFAANAADIGNSCAGDLLLWTIINKRSVYGDLEFRLGRSSIGSGVAKYKEKWNPIFLPVSDKKWYQSSSKGVSSWPLNQTGTKESFSHLWKKIPSSTTNRISPMIRKSLP